MNHLKQKQKQGITSSLKLGETYMIFKVQWSKNLRYFSMRKTMVKLNWHQLVGKDEIWDIWCRSKKIYLKEVKWKLKNPLRFYSPLSTSTSPVKVVHLSKALADVMKATLEDSMSFLVTAKVMWYEQCKHQNLRQFRLFWCCMLKNYIHISYDTSRKQNANSSNRWSWLQDKKHYTGWY